MSEDPAEFCRLLRPRLLGALGLFSGDPGVGEDLTQETLVRVWERWDHVSRLDSPDAWAFRVGFNLATSRFRRLGAERRARARLGASDVVLPDDTFAIAVRDAVAALPPRQRSIVVLRYFADLPVAEVAAVVGCAPGTVKSLTHNALRLLRERLELDELTEEVADARRP